MKYTNDLIHESSPYLLQHAHNPVNWCAWNKNTWQKAIEEDKLVIVSIGYSACHWCHVMEHESFEDEEVAAIMNTYFVSIKVDREERPDVDQIYMDCAQLISGRGGWPLNAICLPDGRPVYAGTYFPKENWIQILQYFVTENKRNKHKMLEQAENVTHGISMMDNFEVKNETDFTQQDNTTAARSILQNQDLKLGGSYGRPKFPMPNNYQFLLQYFFYSKNESVLNAVRTTLDKMMMGGIYDQVGGGFARYSVDEYWAIPHFEKMLYDNSQLVSLYAQAFQITKDENYKRIVEETLAFVARELTGNYGNFYTALDADSDGEEGKFYVWEYDELKEILGDEFENFCKVYSVTENGNFEGANNLIRKEKDVTNATKEHTWKQKLLSERSKRNRPLLDDKTITAWNALMLKAYLEAYLILGEKSYLEAALKSADFIKVNQLSPEGFLYRNFKNGKSTIHGFLDDYAFTIEAFVMLYEVAFKEEWLKLALQLSNYCFEHFFNEEKQIFYYTNKVGEKLIARKTETSDNVIPASNSAMAKNLFKLGLLTENEKFISTAKAMALNFKPQIIERTSFYSNWAMLMRWLTDEPFILAITGNNATETRLKLGGNYLPNCFFAGGNSSLIPSLSDKQQSINTAIYACKNKTCGLPAQNVEEALLQIQS